MTRYVELEVVPAAIEHGIGVIPWSPLRGGLLSGALRKQSEGTADRSSEGRSSEGLEAHRTTIEAYEKLCAEIGQDPANVALAWLLSRPAVTAPIIGATKLAHLEDAIAATSLILDEKELERLEAPYVPHPVLGH